MNEDFLTAKQAADMFGIHVRTLYDWARKGTIPGVKLGGGWRFSKGILDKFLNDRMTWTKAPRD